MPTITHTSPDLIEKICSWGGCAGNGTLFFSTNDYAMGTVGAIYDMEISDDQVIEAKDLDHPDFIARVAELFDVDTEMAESLLDASESEWDCDDCDAEKSWELQGLRAECAQAMGFLACEDQDENGLVYMIRMNDEVLPKMILRAL